MSGLRCMPAAGAVPGRGVFRLPGFGGAAVFLRSGVGPWVDPVTGSPTAQAALRFDVGLLSPQSCSEYRARPTEPFFADRLSAFLLAAAGDLEPEGSVALLVDGELGLTLRVVSSDVGQVGLLVSVERREADPVIEPDADAAGLDGQVIGPEILDFETSRAALVRAAHDARFLDHVDVDPGGRSEPPVDWGAL